MLRPFAKAVSILFHPLLMPTYMLALLLLINPFIFGVNSIFDDAGKLNLLRIFLYTFFIPVFAVAMLRPLGFIRSLEMEDKSERTGPYIITAVFYLWAYMNMKNSSLFPPAYACFMLGAVIALFVTFFINIFSKISAHAVGMGGLLGMVIITMLRFSHDVFTIQTGTFGTISFNMNAVLIIVILLCGIVGTSRLLLHAHEPRDLYGGFMVGFVAQFLALRFSI
ncbi:MAG: hypothetical protein SH848_20875 [Saprospiraceae bacterium]|nr:hypothetical protein [Saprospiraceae bacterium]MDZ4706397.1 hypothetical protein [Saprospiraceae bacterium]